MSRSLQRARWVEFLFCVPLLIPGLLLARALAGVGWSCAFVENHMKVDDPVGAISVHGTNGLWGVLSIGQIGRSHV